MTTSDLLSRGWSLSNGVLLKRTEKTLFGFGQRHVDLPQLKSQFSNLKWAEVKQTHSASIVQASTTNLVEADSHFTNELETALIIKTADCLPILFCTEGGTQVAIHAGWRGVATDIVQNSLSAIGSTARLNESSEVWIGPHIRSQSFEVGRDVADLLRGAALRAGAHTWDLEKIFRPHTEDQEKLMVDLEAIVRLQLQSKGVARNSIQSIGIDTLTTPAWASFRRDRDQAGRNLSFIARL